MTNSLPKKIDKLSGTRWLARYEAVVKILDQWDTLKLHFSLARTNERCYIAEQLYGLLSSNSNKLYLFFLSYILKPLINLKKLFQNDSVDPLKLTEDLNSLFYFYLQLLIVPSQLAKVARKNLSTFQFHNYVMGANTINFGYSFTENSKFVSADELTTIKDRCRNFLIVLCEELQKKIPENIDMLQKISLLSPPQATSQIRPDITELCVAFKHICENVDSIINEWNCLPQKLWIKLDSSEEFWIEVSEDKNSAGEQRFPHISKLALSLLSLPFSNATVERVFSIVNIIKNKLRNRMHVRTADAIMRVRFSLKSSCDHFVPTKDMLQKFNSEIYLNEDSEDNKVLEAFSDEF